MLLQACGLEAKELVPGASSMQQRPIMTCTAVQLVNQSSQAVIFFWHAEVRLKGRI